MEYTKYIPVNFDIISNPLNWLIVLLMVLIASIGFSVVLNLVQVSHPLES